MSAGALAQPFEAPLTDDAGINGNNPTLKLGASDSLVVDNYGPKHGLFKFDTSALTGRSITRATFKFFVRTANTSAPRELGLFAVKSAWSEGSVTWGTRPSLQAGPLIRPVLRVTGIQEVDVTELVQRWASGEIQNHGILLTATGPAQAVIDSKERASGVAVSLTVEAFPPVVADRSRPRVLDFSKPDSCVIDEPGQYVLDRNWQQTSQPLGYSQIVCTAHSDADQDIIIQVTANFVTIDFRGFEVAASGDMDGVVIHLAAHNAVLKNGKVSGGDAFDETGYAIFSGAGGHSLENMTIDGIAWLAAGGSKVLNCDVGELWVGAGSLVEGSRTGGILIFGDQSVLRNNQVRATAEGNLDVGGTGNMVESNSIFCSGCSDAILVRGQNNRVAWNTIRSDPVVAGIRVEGSGNQIDSNAVMIGGASTGIRFDAADNFYGGNRVSAATPFDLRGFRQVDWGGNVSF
jgi:hypothetical protein